MRPNHFGALLLSIILVCAICSISCSGDDDDGDSRINANDDVNNDNVLNDDIDDVNDDATTPDDDSDDDVDDDSDDDVNDDSDDDCEGELTDGFVCVPSGSFQMGSPEDEPGREAYENIHAVQLTNAIEMMRHEVAQGLYESIMGYNPSSFSSRNDSQPVERVSWWDALAFSINYSIQEGYPPCYLLSDIWCVDGTQGQAPDYCGGHGYIDRANLELNNVDSVVDCAGYRLPTEAEWEYAARAGTDTAFYTGDIANQECEPLDSNLDSIGWYCGNAEDATHDVGLKTANDFDLHDMSGNVREWVWDWYNYDYYTQSPESDPAGPSVGSSRACRGGAWGFVARKCRSAARDSSPPDQPNDDLGFRLVRTLGIPVDDDMDDDLDDDVNDDVDDDVNDDLDDDVDDDLDDDTGDDDVSEGFVAIDAGQFQMGSPTNEPGRGGDEILRTVTLTHDFELMTREVTQKDFEDLTGSNRSQFWDCGENCPVEYVSWFDAVAYTIFLSNEAGLEPCYILSDLSCYDSSPGDDIRYCQDNYGIVNATIALNNVDSVYECIGYRLPTEAEWEYAARATTTTAFYNGDITYTECDPLDPNLFQIGWYCGNASGSPHPVGLKDPNSWGLYDMSGNVYEWVWDTYANYGSLPPVDPEGQPVPGLKAHRGGAWNNNAEWCRSAHRFKWQESYRSYNLGFRVARTLSELNSM